MAARAIPLLLLPWCLWRLPFAFGFQMGLLPNSPQPWHWWHIGYVFGLTPPSYANGWWAALAAAGIAPGMLWGPAVLTLTHAYYVRRCRR
ncbi:hypothetical protein OG455_25600 [Kitasatospora sp. NBC_01287]|uniref:hypothetical protein n=1 Tax=Kitasatospora sp. NBC_01287 TaxID=2903573 RepID=UPI00225A9C80|nr:hypothetical protein [Kitasatospora sp. NBC_01287]MCX4748849.1 hypothetical protein [Kitasatospora sp. NBC_01287]